MPADDSGHDLSAPSPIPALSRSLGQDLIGHERLIERLLIGLLGGGHVLIEGAPGLAKTRAAKLLARGLDVSFARIQCTPDLMPADLTGTAVWRPDRGQFEFLRGPLFHALVLVDEINRAPPKVQSALLEAMAERQITAAGETHVLPQPFMVVATQNSIEHEGTYPLPEAQLDRFLLQVVLDLPGQEDERRILDLVEAERTAAPRIELRIAPGEIGEACAAAARTYLAPALKDYIVRLVTATRDGRVGEDVAKAIQHPISPRGTLALAQAAKMRAWLHGRDHATPDDVLALAGDTLAHRLVLTWRAQADGLKARDIVARLIERIPAA
jgi:MoxR-like ATPase